MIQWELGIVKRMILFFRKMNKGINKNKKEI